MTGTRGATIMLRLPNYTVLGISKSTATLSIEFPLTFKKMIFLRSLLIRINELGEHKIHYILFLKTDISL